MLRTLERASLDDIHDAFVDAFSEYEVRIEMPKEALWEMMVTRGFDAHHSLGYFTGERLVGFVLVGFRPLEGSPCYYDIAMGVRRESQGSGIAARLVKELVSRMETLLVEGFVLEVLENNIRAQTLYMSHGFQISRRLHCYELEAHQLDQTHLSGFGLAQSSVLDSVPIEEFCSFRPSWQNSLDSYRSAPDFYRLGVHFADDGGVDAYGIVHRTNGRVLQLGITPRIRTEQLARAMLGFLASHTTSPLINMVNVEADSATDRLLRTIGFRPTVNQYEMFLKRNQG